MPRHSNVIYANGGWKGARYDTFEAGQNVDPRSNFEMFQRKLLDGCGIDLGILQVESTPSIMRVWPTSTTAPACAGRSTTGRWSIGWRGIPDSGWPSPFR